MPFDLSRAQETARRYLISDVYDIVYDAEGSEGAYIRDLVTGRRYLDFNTFVASNPLGHNHPKLKDPEFEKKLLRAARVKVANSDFRTPDSLEFIEAFVRYAVPKDFHHLFFVEGGALGVENAMKAAFDWKVRLNLERGLPGHVGTKVIYFEEAFHGRAGYSMSATQTFDPRKTMYFPRFDWPTVSNPKLRFPAEGKNLEQTIETEKKALKQLDQIRDKYGHDIAALIIEPIQSEGGDNHFRPEFHQALRRWCSEHEVMLIHDEVQTGIGLTGKMWAHEHMGVVPDLVCFGKKTQVCGFMSTNRIDQAAQNVFVEPMRINSTWGGNLVDMVRCAKYLEVIHEERLVENARVMGEKLLQSLKDLAVKYPNLISNVRGRGLLCAFDLPNLEQRNLFQARMKERNVMVLKCGANTIRLRPPLIFSADDLAQFLEAAEATLKSY